MTELTQFYEVEWPKILPEMEKKKIIASYQKLLMASVVAKTKKNWWNM